MFFAIAVSMYSSVCFESANGVVKKDLACTLALLFYFGGKAAAAQVGDGAIVGAFSDGRMEIIVKPVDSEYINEVTPITSPDWKSRMNMTAGASAPVGLVNAAVFTDGCIGAVTVKKDGNIEPFEGFFRPLFDYFNSKNRENGETGESDGSENGENDDNNGNDGNSDIAGLLSSEKMCSVSDDDKTLAVACFKEE